MLETELGDPRCRRLTLEVWAPQAKGLCSLEELGLRSPVEPPCRILLDQAAGPAAAAEASLVRFEPAFRARCGPLYPKAVAHAFEVQLGGGREAGPPGERRMVYSPSGPLPHLTKEQLQAPDVLLHGPACGNSGLRRLSAEEARRLWGPDGAGTDQASARDLADDPCRRAAGAIALWAACSPATVPARCGVCRDPDSERNEALIWKWLWTWRAGGYPSDCAQQEYSIFVDGRPGVRQMQVHAGTLAEELHERLAALSGRAADSFYLRADGHRLSAQKSLGAAGVNRDCTVRVQGRLLGGAAGPPRSPSWGREPAEEERTAELPAFVAALNVELLRD